MKQKQLLFLMIAPAIILSSLFTACSNYFSRSTTHLPASGSSDIVFENRYWENSQDSSQVTMELPAISNKLQPGDIRSVIIIEKGKIMTAGYLNWGRDNLYKYEIVNSRIILYRQTENLLVFYEPVTIVIRF